MATFYNFAFKIETSLAKRVAKPILETRNANDVIAYVWFNIYSFSDKKDLKTFNLKKNNSTCTKFTMKKLK